MASFKIKMPEDFLLKISNLGENTDLIMNKVLEAGAKVVQDEVDKSLKSVIGKNTKNESHSTDQLQRSLGTSRVLQDRNGNFNIKVGFAENRNDGATNSMIANIIEYGKSNQKAKPFLKPALRKAKEPCIEAMVKTLDEEISKL